MLFVMFFYFGAVPAPPWVLNENAAGENLKEWYLHLQYFSDFWHLNHCKCQNSSFFCNICIVPISLAVDSRLISSSTVRVGLDRSQKARCRSSWGVVDLNHGLMDLS